MPRWSMVALVGMLVPLHPLALGLSLGLRHMTMRMLLVVLLMPLQPGLALSSHQIRLL